MLGHHHAAAQLPFSLRGFGDATNPELAAWVITTPGNGTIRVTGIAGACVKQSSLLSWLRDAEVKGLKVRQHLQSNMTICETVCFTCFLLLTLTFSVVLEASRSCPVFCWCYSYGKNVSKGTKVICRYDKATLPALFDNVTFIRIHNDDLSAVDGFSFQEVPSLQELMLYTDNLEHINKDAFHGLNYLWRVTIKSKSAVEIDHGVFSSTGNLRYLNLKVGLQNIPTQLCDASNLSILILKGNNITSAMFPQCGMKLTSLRTIVLSMNPLKRLGSSDFYPLRQAKITTFLARGCGLTKLPFDYFKYLGSLRVLDISGNKITSLPPDIFRSVKDLTNLTLSNNSLLHMPLSETWPFISNLKSLVLSGNTNMNMSFGNQSLNATSLKVLKLEFNKIGNLEDFTFSAFSRSPITSLYLTGSKIERITTDSLKPFTRLQVLYLQGNRISPDALRNLSFGVSDSLQYLSFGAGILKIDNTTFSGFSSQNGLLELVIKDVSRLEIKEGTFQSFGKLQTLSLVDCHLKHMYLHQDALKGLKSLKRMNLSRNQLTAIPKTRHIGKFPSLTFLDLSHNVIDFLNKGWLQWLWRTYMVMHEL